MCVDCQVLSVGPAAESQRQDMFSMDWFASHMALALCMMHKPPEEAVQAVKAVHAKAHLLLQLHTRLRAE